jgi:hypothetical protein
MGFIHHPATDQTTPALFSATPKTPTSLFTKGETMDKTLYVMIKPMME